jgi:hypothetical protein
VDEVIASDGCDVSITPMTTAVGQNALVLGPLLLIAAGIGILFRSRSAWIGLFLGLLIVAGIFVVGFAGDRLGLASGVGSARPPGLHDRQPLALPDRRRPRQRDPGFRCRTGAGSMIHQVNGQGPVTAVGRNGFREYNEKGYVAYPEYREASAKTLEYAYNDFCLARFAQILGKTEVPDTMDMASLLKQHEAHVPEVRIEPRKDLVHLEYGVLAGTLAFGLAYSGLALRYGRRRDLNRAMFWGGVITLAPIVIFGAAVLVSPDLFEQIYYQLHLLGFSNDLWQLDPARDYLIMMFPEGFWSDAAGYIAMATVGIAVVLGGLSAAYLRLAAKAE